MPGANEIRAGEAYVEIGTRIGPKFERGLASVRSKLNAFAARWAKRGAFVLGAGLAAGTGLAVREFAKFERQMADVSTMLSSETMPMLKGLGQDVSRLAVTYGESTDALTTGLYDILSASVHASHAMGILEAATKGAKAGASETGVSVSALLTILKTYDDSLRDAADASDFMFSVVKRGRTTYGQLSSSIGLVASDASAAGLKLTDLGAALATMTRQGVSTDMAVTRLRAVLATFLKPQEQSVKAAKEFGLELNTATLKSIGLTGVMEKLKDARAEDVAAIFTERRALSGMNTLLGAQGDFIEDTRLMTDRAGATQEAFEKQTDSLSYAMDKGREAGLALARSVGEKLSPVIKDITTKLGDWLGSDSAREWGTTTAAAIGTVLEKVGGLAKKIPEVVAGLDALFSMDMDKALAASRSERAAQYDKEARLYQQSLRLISERGYVGGEQRLKELEKKTKGGRPWFGVEREMEYWRAKDEEDMLKKALADVGQRVLYHAQTSGGKRYRRRDARQAARELALQALPREDRLNRSRPPSPPKPSGEGGGQEGPTSAGMTRRIDTLSYRSVSARSLSGATTGELNRMGAGVRRQPASEDTLRSIYDELRRFHEKPPLAFLSTFAVAAE